MLSVITELGPVFSSLLKFNETKKRKNKVGDE